ncbi:MAG: ABC transporter ATP-binding protein [Dongiaceae bacterium]
MAGMDSPTSGHIYFDGRPIENVPPEKRNIAMVFQSIALYPQKTVYENIAFPLRMARIPAPEIDERVRAAATLMRIAELLNRKPHELSGGQRQRVALGRAAVRKPVAFLFDEPLSALDAKLRTEMRVEIKKLHERLESTFIYVTHDQVEALTMADRIAVMRDGVIEQCASPHDIFARPTNLFVAGFIGTPQMNLLPGVLVGSEEPPSASTPEGRGGGAAAPTPGSDRSTFARFRLGNAEVVIVVDPAVARLAPGSAVTLGIRPRSVDLVSEAGSESLAARIDLVEPMGAETLLHLVEGGRDFRVVVDRRAHTRVGERVYLRFKPGQTHVFDMNEKRVAS